MTPMLLKKREIGLLKCTSIGKTADSNGLVHILYSKFGSFIINLQSSRITLIHFKATLTLILLPLANNILI